MSRQVLDSKPEAAGKNKTAAESAWAMAVTHRENKQIEKQPAFPKNGTGRKLPLF